MELSGFWAVFLTASFGGALAELIKWYGMRESDNLPSYARSARYWLITAGMIMCGGILATLYGTTKVSALLAVNIGASAPLIISSLAKTVAPAETTRGGERATPARPSVANFLAGR